MADNHDELDSSSDFLRNLMQGVRSCRICLRTSRRCRPSTIWPKCCATAADASSPENFLRRLALECRWKHDASDMR